MDSEVTRAFLKKERTKSYGPKEGEEKIHSFSFMNLPKNYGGDEKHSFLKICDAKNYGWRKWP